MSLGRLVSVHVALGVFKRKYSSAGGFRARTRCIQGPDRVGAREGRSDWRDAGMVVDLFAGSGMGRHLWRVQQTVEGAVHQCRHDAVATFIGVAEVEVETGITG